MVRERSGEVNIPLDLKLEILKKLPAKSVVRFLCVSKQWKTIIRDYLVDSIVPRSLIQLPHDPHFILQRVHWSGISKKTYSFAYYHHHQTTHEEENLVFHNETSQRDNYCILDFQYVRGLIGMIGYEASPSSCFHHQFTIHNPTTRQTVSLPNIVTNRTQSNGIFNFFFGYDPLSNKYKVVYMCPKHYKETSIQVFTLGDLKNRWRNIRCGIERHYPFHRAVCINGVIYYKASRTPDGNFVLVSFDVGFERFNHVEIPEKLSICLGDATLVDYQGKLGCICKDKLDLNLWVLENAERQEWSKITYIDALRGLPSSIRFAGITYPGGEIVIVPTKLITPIVCYYDTKLKKIRKVEIKTTSRERISIVSVVTDHVDNIMSLSSLGENPRMGGCRFMSLFYKFF